MSPPPLPNDRRGRRENTDVGGYGAPSPRIRERSDDPETARRIQELEEQAAKLLSENRHLEQKAAKAEYLRSYSPPPSSLVAPPVGRVEIEETHRSMRPGRDWVISALRLAGPKAWIVLLVGVILWGLGGHDGIAKLIREWRSGETQALVTAMTARISALETETTRLRNALVAQRAHQLELQGAQSQVFERMGVDWPLEAGAPAPALLRFEQPIRRPGSVTKGPTLIVQTPMRVPPPIPSSTP